MRRYAVYGFRAPRQFLLGYVEAIDQAEANTIAGQRRWSRARDDDGPSIQVVEQPKDTTDD